MSTTPPDSVGTGAVDVVGSAADGFAIVVVVVLVGGVVRRHGLYIILFDDIVGSLVRCGLVYIVSMYLLCDVDGATSCLCGIFAAFTDMLEQRLE